MIIIEKSPSNRAKCPFCNKYISKDEPRIRIETSYDNHLSYYCLHLECFLRINSDFLNNVLNILLSSYFKDSPEALEHVNRLIEISKIKDISKSLGRKEI